MVWGLLASASVTGCGDGGSLDGLGGDSTDGGHAEQTGADPAPGLDTGGAGSTGEEVPPFDDDTGVDACELDCGPGGICDFDDAGAPACICDPGFVAYGLRCLPCTPSTGEIDIEIPRVAVTATFSLNGEPFPGGLSQRGAVELRDPASGDAVALGFTSDGGTLAPVSLLPGNYEVYYTHVAGDQRVPGNRAAKVQTVSIPRQASFELDIDVPGIELSGDFTMNGESPPGGLSENGWIVLRDRSTGDEVELGQTRDERYRVMVVPGVYDVHYRRIAAQAMAPFNHDARVDVVEIEPAAGEDAQVFDIDVPVTTLAGIFTIDGAPPPSSLAENGRILLRDLVTGDEIELGQTRGGAYSAPIVRGAYEIIYQHLTGGAQVPVNRAAVLGTATPEAGDQALDIDVATAVISGSITVGGAPAPASPDDDGLILMRSPQTGDEAVLGNTAAGTYSRRVVVGTYDVHYRQKTSSGNVPANTNARLQSIEVRGGATFDVDVPVVTVSASVTVGGEAPPESAYDDGLLYLRNELTGDSVLLGNTRRAQLERTVVPGTYELLYVVEAAGPTMPVNADARLDTLEIGPGSAIDVDIPVIDLTGAVTVDGQAPPQGLANQAVLLLSDQTTEDTIYLGAIEAGSLRTSVTAGTYVVVYRSITSDGALPANDGAGLACIELSAP